MTSLLLVALLAEGLDFGSYGRAGETLTVDSAGRLVVELPPRGAKVLIQAR